MPIFPIRDLSKYGVITDIDPYGLPTEAWSMAVNVRFHDGSIERGPIFKTAKTLTNVSPRFVDADSSNTGFSSIIVGSLSGRVTSVQNGNETDLSTTGYVDANAEEPFTSCKLGDVYYVNRGDRVPWSLRVSDTIFQPLANWDSSWRAKLLRACGGALCAFGITKAGVSFPTMVKTSEFALADTVPSSWDETDPTTNATENILAEMKTPIVDAQNLGESMIIYGLNETWAMQADGSDSIWSYHKLFDNKGAINANCSIEVDKKHYVFGLHDVWMHDGISTKSICDKRVKRFIFNSIDMNRANRCFVSYNPLLNEVYFNYVSADAYTGFSPDDGCNRCAAYNISEDTWTFYDLPYVYGMAIANVDTTDTWDSLTNTWASIGGTWLDEQDSLKRIPVFVGDDNAAAGLTRTLYVFDMVGASSYSSLPVNITATKSWLLERSGIDLDEVGADLRGYKLLSSIYPQAHLDPDASPLLFTVGSSDYFNQNPSMAGDQSYDGHSFYKLDYNMAGRWLLIKVHGSDYHYFNLTGFDLDLDVIGER